MTQTASSLPLFLIEPRPRLRAAITHHLSLHGLHVEPFEALNEFTDRNFESGIVLVNDDLSLSSQLARWIQKGGSKLVHIAYAVELSASRVLRAVNEGAINFIEWPADKDRLMEAQQLMQSGRQEDANRILQELMGAPVRNQQIEGELQALFELIDQERFDEARAAILTLERRLGEDEPELTRASSLICFLEGSE